MITADIQGLEPGARVELFELDATAIAGGGLLRFHGYQQAGTIWWQGVEYTAWPIKAEGFAKTSEGQQPTPKLSVGNVDGSISSLCILLDDLVGAKLTRHVTLGQYLDEANFPPTPLDSPSFVSRASPATYFDANGVLQTAAANVARYGYDPITHAALGLIAEGAATNAIRNNTMAGAVAGSPGTLPTNWNISLSSGLSSSVVGVGTEDGIKYIDVRIFGTPTGASSGIRFEPNTSVAAATGQTWSLTGFVRRVAGSSAGLTTVGMNIAGYTSGGVSAESLTGANAIGNLGVGSIVQNRSSVVRTLSSATSAYARPQLFLGHTVGAPVDITLRVGMPQLELGSAPTSVIATSTGAVMRAADVTTMFGPGNPTADPEQEFPPDTWFIEQKTSETNEVVEFELASALDFQDTQLPRRQIIANLCPFGYRGSYCGYAGTAMFDTNDNPVTDPALDACSKTLGGCKKRFGATSVLNFGGFPAAALIQS